MKYLVIALFLVGCASSEASQEEVIAEATPSIPAKPYAPKVPAEPEPIRQCEVTKSLQVKDCTLYFLMCDDGQPDMILICPPVYWERGEYIPTPP